jgi:hypothetical protein
MAIVMEMVKMVPRRGPQQDGPPVAGRDVLFEYAPPVGVQRRLGLVTPDNLNIRRRALLLALLGWAPLFLLAILQSVWLQTDDLTPLLRQIGVHARYLVAVPLLVLAEAVCAPQLNAIVRNFVSSGIVGERDRGRLGAAVASTYRLLQEPVAELLVIALAYLIVVAALLSHPADQLPAWAGSGGITPVYSPAGWWHTLVSLPLLLTLTLGWMWRLAVWTRLLWKISRLELKLVASHPDHCAGLAFLGQSVRAFAIVALALAAVVAGRSAQIVLDGGGLPTPHLWLNIGLIVALAALFVAPLLVFTPVLMRAWRRGALEYGALAEGVGQAFERKWLGARKTDQDVLGQPDFSATTDLYQVVSNVYAIRFLPVGLKDLAMLVVAMLLPFVPVLLLAFPTDVIWAHARSLLF